MNKTQISELYDEADKLFSKGQYKEALEKWEEVIREKPNYRGAIHNKACCLWSLGKADEAIECYDLALKIKRTNTSLYMKAIVLKSQGQFMEALENCNLAAETQNDGDTEADVIADLKEEIIIAEKYNKIYFKSSQPPSNKEELELFLDWAKSFCKRSGLKLGGFKMCNNEFFSNDYLSRLVKDKYIILNKDFGKKPKIEKSDIKMFSKKVDHFVQKMVAEHRVQPWYYLGEGKLFKEDIIKKNFQVKDKWVILNRFKQTKRILLSQSKIRQKGFQVHDDWWGTYFLELTSLPGKEFHEVEFNTRELYNLRAFIKKERIKGAVLCYINSDEECPIYDINLSSVLDLFDAPKLQYLKLFFVSKVKIQKAPIKKSEPEDGVNKFIALPCYDNKVKWVLAYSK